MDLVVIPAADGSAKCLPGCLNPAGGVHHAKCPNRGRCIAAWAEAYIHDDPGGSGPDSDVGDQTFQDFDDELDPDVGEQEPRKKPFHLWRNHGNQDTVRM